jgi:UDP-glucose 4-epimerase
MKNDDAKNNNGNKILVTGGAGFIGSHLVELLEEKGLEVIVADNFSKGSRDNLKNTKATVEVIDIASRSQVAMLFGMYGARISSVIHLAAFTSLQESMNHPDVEVRTNVLGTVNIANAARDAGVGKFVFSSSAAVYGSPREIPVTEEHPAIPECIYGISKFAGEKYIQILSKNHMSCTILRFGNVYGERQRMDKGGDAGVTPIFMNCLENGLPVKLRANGKAVRDYVYVGDIVNGIYCALNAPSGIFNLATKTGTDVETLWNTMLEYYKPNPVPETKKEPLLPGEIEKMIISAEKAYNEMGWKPKVAFRDGMKKTVEWYKNREQE